MQTDGQMGMESARHVDHLYIHFFIDMMFLSVCYKTHENLNTLFKVKTEFLYV